MLAIHALLVPVLLHAVPDPVAPDSGWVGKIVFARSLGTKIHHVDERGNLIPIITLMGLEYAVLAERNDRVQLKTRQGEVGWVEKKDMVSLEDAIAFFSQRIERDPNDHDALNRRAWAWKLKGEFDAAIKDFTEALRLREDPAFYNNRALVWQAKKDYDQAIVDYSHAIRMNPQYALPYSNRGVMWNHKKEYDKAIDDFSAAVRIDPKFINAFRNRGNAWHAKKQEDLAIADYSQVIRIDPRSPHAFTDRGVAWLAKKDFEKARADFAFALEIDPKFAPAHYQRGRAWSVQKQDDKAIEDFSAALRLDPKHVLALAERGAAWSRKKSYEKALADFNQAVRIDAKNSAACAAAALLLASCPDAKIRDGKRALELAKRALPENKDSPLLLEALAAAHAELGQFADAVRVQQHALESAELENEPAARRRLELYRKMQPSRQE